MCEDDLDKHLGKINFSNLIVQYPLFLQNNGDLRGFYGRNKSMLAKNSLEINDQFDILLRRRGF